MASEFQTKLDGVQPFLADTAAAFASLAFALPIVNGVNIGGANGALASEKA